MDKNKSEIQALVYLLGDDQVEIANTARKKLLELGPEIVTLIEEEIEEHSLKVRLRARQVINWLQTESRTWELPAYIPRFKNR